MSGIRFEIAGPADDAQLRDLLASTPMDGPVRVSLRREPNFFQACAVEGPFHQTLVARDGSTIAAAGCRSVRERYLNGHPMPVGYLSGLRLRPQYRGSGLLGRGYRFLYDLHQDRRTCLYLTTIAQGNTVAQQLLTSGRSWLPRYHPAGVYHTFLIPPKRARGQNRTHNALQIRRATNSDWPRILQLLQQIGPQRQFFPCYTLEDFSPQSGGAPGRNAFPGLQPGNLLLAEQHGQLVGMLGTWDQRAFRQTVVESYRGLTGSLRHVYNLWARWRGAPRLPAPRSVLPGIAAVLPVVQNDDARLFQQLLAQLLHDLETDSPAVDRPYLLLGMHDSDPLWCVARRWAFRAYKTSLYCVCWPDGESLREELDGRPRYLELGCL